MSIKTFFKNLVDAQSMARNIEGIRKDADEWHLKYLTQTSAREAAERTNDSLLDELEELVKYQKIRAPSIAPYYKASVTELPSDPVRMVDAKVIRIRLDPLTATYTMSITPGVPVPKLIMDRFVKDAAAMFAENIREQLVPQMEKVS